MIINIYTYIDKKVARIKFTYNAMQPDELTISSGEQVVILEQMPNGWARVEYNGTVGMFPCNYMDIMEASSVPSSAASSVSSYGTMRGQGPSASSASLVAASTSTSNLTTITTSGRYIYILLCYRDYNLSIYIYIYIYILYFYPKRKTIYINIYGITNNLVSSIYKEPTESRPRSKSVSEKKPPNSANKKMKERILIHSTPP